ncbi:hypothetical protein [Prosthecobacter sp.]|uniref:hypothetical protein n=1 Tax=Prosthecobacter sp. TaxID=1965333 RepID=UPI0037843C81
MNVEIYTPEAWLGFYREGLFSRETFFDGLIRYVKFHDPAIVISFLPADDMEEFKSLLARYAAIKDYSRLLRIGDPPVFDKTEVDKLAKTIGHESIKELTSQPAVKCSGQNEKTPFMPSIYSLN